MINKLDILHLEDSVYDMELIRSYLFDVYPFVQIKQVQNKDQFLAAIEGANYNIILADYNVSQFSAMEALKITRNLLPNTIFICVSGTIGEEKAVELLKTGATDYVLKDNLDKLKLAIDRAIKEEIDRNDKQMAIRELKKTHDRYYSLFNNVNDGILTLDSMGRILEVNETLRSMLDYDENNAVGLRNFEDFICDEDKPDYQHFLKNINQPGCCNLFTCQLKKSAGDKIWVEINTYPIFNSDGKKCGDWLLVRDVSTKKQQEKQIHENAELLMSVFDNTSTGIAVMDPDFNFITVNQAYADADEKNPEYFKGKNHFDLYPYENNIEIFREVVHTGIPRFINAKPFEFKKNPERGVGYWDWSLIPLRDENGAINRLVLSCIDVTEKIKSEEQIRLNEERLRIASNVTGLGIYDWNLVTGDIHWDNRHREIHGIDQKIDRDLLTYLMEILHPDDRDYYVQLIEKIRSADYRAEIDQNEYRIIIEGKVKHIWTSRIYHRNKKGEIIRVIGGCLDITERRKSEIELKISKDKYKSLFENNLAGVYKISFENEVINCNNAFAKIIGYYSKDDVIGKKTNELFEKLSSHNFFDQILTNKNLMGYETQLRLNDGREIWILENAAIFKFDHAEPKHIFGTVIDITESKNHLIQLTEERTQGFRYQSRLLSSQINPHFMFNALNSIQYYILDSSTEPALEFLSNFSQLIRKTLYNSRNDFITIDQEIEFLKQYINLEQMRFKSKFDCVINVDSNIDIEEILVPPMLFQPYIENAIIHGLGNKMDKGHLEIDFNLSDNALLCRIIDNGVGRKKAEEANFSRINTRHKSMGMSITSKRLDILNKLGWGEIKVNVEDVLNEIKEVSGTQVIIEMPLSLGK